MAFEWTTLNGSCAVCLALEGYYDEEPKRPHDYCDCEIVDEHETPTHSDCWATIDEDSDLYVDGIVTITVNVFKVCADGDQVQGYYDTEQTFDEWYAAWIENSGGEEWEEWHQEVWNAIDAMCEQELEDECTTFVDPTP
jgi:hypothetical protein